MFVLILIPQSGVSCSLIATKLVAEDANTTHGADINLNDKIGNITWHRNIKLCFKRDELCWNCWEAEFYLCPWGCDTFRIMLTFNVPYPFILKLNINILRQWKKPSSNHFTPIALIYVKYMWMQLKKKMQSEKQKLYFISLRSQNKNVDGAILFIWVHFFLESIHASSSIAM